MSALANREGLITIYEISKILSSSLDLQKTLRAVLIQLSNYLSMQRGMISLVQPSGELQLVAVIGLTAEETKTESAFSAKGVAGRILRSGMPAVVPDIAKEALFIDHPRRVALPPGAHSFLGVPINVGRESIGVLALERIVTKTSAQFQEDLRFLTMIANLIGQTVALHQRVADDRYELLQERSLLKNALRVKYSLENVIGGSKAMQRVFAEVHQAAPGRSTVLLRGESGSGKELIAQAIHCHSPRAEASFIKVNCAALSESILESELFGHEKGAFTGATAERKGRFELANGGTLFMDEIGDISPAFQVKLLRVLQEREFERVGGNRTIKVDVRLIAATNRNLEEMVMKGQYRADLYYRINVVSISIPPLRERKEDIPLLAKHFLERLNRETGRRTALAPSAMKLLLECAWPGNVRELENCIERAATMTAGDSIGENDIPCRRNECFSSVLWPAAATRRPFPVPVVAGNAAVEPAEEAGDGSEAMADNPQALREQLITALEKCGWVQAKAARMLNMTPRQIGYALKKCGIQVKQL